MHQQAASERPSFADSEYADGSRWKLSEQEAIAGIWQGRWSFYVEVNGRRVGVIVAEHEGRQYLKTEADGLQPNNLLSLPECP